MQVFLTCILLMLTIFISSGIVIANKDREAFTDLLQKRKHLNGYWVGKRSYLDEDSYDHDRENVYSTDLLDDDHLEAKRASYLVGKRGT
ncbi:unnamed protein product, partial [Didymodactylos carnosus]